MDGHGKNPESDVSIPTKALQGCYNDIGSEISLLNKMSNVIRRASKEDTALKMKMKTFQIEDEDKDIERTLLGIFKHHINDKFPRASDTIQQRLAEAMIFRRKRILYWRYRQEAATKLLNADLNVSHTAPKPRPPISSAQIDTLQQNKQKSRAAEPVIASSEIQSATTLQPDKFKLAATSPSVGSAMTIALSDHETLDFPIAPGAAAKRKYEQLKMERLAAHNSMLDKFDKAYPDRYSREIYRFDEQDSRTIAEKDLELEAIMEADIQALGEITCPYCLEALPAIEVFDHPKWR